MQLKMCSYFPFDFFWLYSAFLCLCLLHYRIFHVTYFIFEIIQVFLIFFFNGVLTETLLAFFENKKPTHPERKQTQKQSQKNPNRNTKQRADLENRALELLNIHKKQWTSKTFNTYTNEVYLRNGDS